MNKQIHWNKDFLSNSFDLTWNDRPVGEIKVKTSTRSASAEFNGQRYLFDSEGFFKRRTTIYDASNRQPIGLIEYNTWRYKATILLNSKRYLWKLDSMFNSRWSIFKDNGELVIYSASHKKGAYNLIDSDDELLLLCGLVISSKFRTYSF